MIPPNWQGQPRFFNLLMNEEQGHEHEGLNDHHAEDASERLAVMVIAVPEITNHTGEHHEANDK